jgi:hypothetical protein
MYTLGIWLFYKPIHAHSWNITEIMKVKMNLIFDNESLNESGIEYDNES